MFTPAVPGTAIIPWKGTNSTSNHPGSEMSSKSTSESPHDLIMQESIASLIDEVTGLRLRCEGLHQANVQLDERTTELECKSYDDVERAPLTKANLTGYAYSEDSTEDPYGDHSHHGSYNDDRFHVIGQLLEQYQQRFEASEARQTKTEKHIAKLTAYMISSQALFTALKHELYGLDDAQEHPGASHQLPTLTGEPAEEIRFKYEQVLGRFEDLESGILARISSLEDHVGARRYSQVEIEDSDKMGLEPSEKIKRDVHKLKNFAKAITRKHEQERLIDDAHTQDMLYRYYADLSSMANNSEEMRGPFKGTMDEVWQLRDRVLCRLAMYDQYCEAFEDAQKAVKDL